MFTGQGEWSPSEDILRGCTTWAWLALRDLTNVFLSCKNKTNQPTQVLIKKRQATEPRDVWIEMIALHWGHFLRNILLTPVY